jgi:hypothetical protein
VPAAPRVLGPGDVDIDTDATASGNLCDQATEQRATYCVVTGAPLTLSAGVKLTAHGDKPLVLLSTAKLELLGDIDVSSHRGGQRGPGANPAAASACSFMTAPIGPSMGGGGYGGSFGTAGGDGGNAAVVTTGGGVAGTKLEGFPTALRGGCRGGDGSKIVDPVAGGGDGGGAIAMVAAMQIHVDARINASGGGGEGGAMNASNGGGGGGTGGMIVFDSPVPLTFGPRIQLWANGGGGAQGGSAPTGVEGGESSGPTQAAPGGAGTGGGVGGNGSLGSGTGAGGASATAGGGGGGGGGAGFIHAPGFSDANSISPPSSDPPAAP